MTDRSLTELTENAVRVDLGPVARKQLEGIVGQAAGGLLAALLEALGHDPQAGWSLTIERAHLDHQPHQPHQPAAPARPSNGTHGPPS